MQNENKFYLERFDSIEAYINALETRPKNAIFARVDHYASDAGTKDFTGTNSYKDSVELMRKGYSDGLKDLEEAGFNVRASGRTSRTIPSSGPVGHSPIVANAILGLPNSMLTRKSTTIKNRIVSIWFDMTAAFNISTARIALAGCHVLQLVANLEAKGYRVELNMMTSSIGNRQIAGAVVKVKSERQPMNPLKIAYPMLHASYLRRQDFRWLETAPKLTDESMTEGYGKPFYTYGSYETRVKELKRNGILPENAYYISHNEAYDNSASDLASLIGLN